MEISKKHITDLQRQIDACSAYIDALSQGYRSPEKVNTLLDAAMQKIETACIDMRRLCEEYRPKLPNFRFGHANYHIREISGEVTLMDTGWLDIRLNALLPHCKITGGTEYISDTISRLLNSFKDSGGDIPSFNKAFLAIVEHAPIEVSGAFDHDNKGFKAVVNALKGRLFPDDNQFEMSLGLFTVQDEDACCHIYAMPFESAGDFLYQMSDELL